MSTAATATIECKNCHTMVTAKDAMLIDPVTKRLSWDTAAIALCKDCSPHKEDS